MRRLFYDLETDGEFPQYCNMTLCGILVEDDDPTFGLDNGEVYIWEAPFTAKKLEEIEATILNCDERIGFNNVNFDDLVLANYGIKVPEKGTQDAMLAIKTVKPGLPAHGLKFLSWLLLGDPDWAEFELEQEGHKFGDLVTDKLRAYHRYDLIMHKNIWEYIKDDVRKSEHWDAYQLDMRMKAPLEEITFEGGLHINVEKCESRLADLQRKKDEIVKQTLALTKGQVQNPNSNKQIGNYLANVEDWALNLTGTGEFQVKKKDLAEIIGMTDEEMRKWQIGQPAPISEVAMLAWQIRDNETDRKFIANYYKAAIGTNCNGWIPLAYGISRAVTRRTLSKSYYKINFQNSTENIDEFKIIPAGYLGWFIDSTQIENVVHIYESQDDERRKSYEADSDWNEYVWLCNRILGTDKNKKELDSIKSTQVPHWSVYKLYKTVKLALNFGMGIKKFCETLNLDYEIGKSVFNDIHMACPAIKRLQAKVERDLRNKGYVQDSFGHIYQGEEPYKVVAYLVQGCGTGSLPKAQVRANWETEQKWKRVLRHPEAFGALNSMTHDECSGLIAMDIGEDNVKAILREFMYNMTKRFSSKFGGIPLRAKLYLSTTNFKDRKHNEQPNWKNTITIPSPS